MIPCAILIAGPTASGKSALAVRLAQRHGGVIINADSMQVYRDLAILTARPGPPDLAAAPHRLYGHVRGDEAYSVGSWVADAAATIAACQRDGLVPIVVGGTGLYFKALLEGLSPIPAIPADVREHWRAEAKRLEPQALHALLAGRDPDTAAKLQPTDPQRLTRALEVLDATSRGLADWQREPGVPVLAAADALCLVVAQDRTDLHRRADARFDQMITAGALDEARALGDRGYSAELPVMRALGVAPLIAAARGELALDNAIVQAKLDTRQYIKRQETWLRRNMMSWKLIQTQDMESIELSNFTFTRS